MNLFKKAYALVEQKHEQALALRNKMFYRGLMAIGLAIGLYGAHYLDFMTGFAYFAQALLLLASIPMFIAAAVIFWIEFSVTSKVDAVVATASRGNGIAEAVLGEAKDIAIEKIKEKAKS